MILYVKFIQKSKYNNDSDDKHRQVFQLKRVQ